MVDLFNRIAGIVIALVLLVAGLFVLLGPSLIPPASLEGFPALRELLIALQGFLERDQGTVLAAGGAATVLGALLLGLQMHNPRKSRRVTIHRDKTGTVTISLVGLRRLADHVIGAIPGVQASVSEAQPTSSGLVFRCQVAVAPEASTLQLAEEIRARVSEAVENHTGRPVARVHVDAQVSQPGAQTGARLGALRKRVQ
jgi:hypothetical protein